MVRSSSIHGLDVRDLGRRPYAETLAYQKLLQQEVISGRAPGGKDGGDNGGRDGGHNGGPMYLLLVEHDPPVITVSRRANAASHLVATSGQLRTAGVDVAETDRGGDITYHGPGQLVVYPILDLNVFGLRVHSYMRFLEQIVIDVLETFGLRGERDTGATGVWLGEAPDSRKICAMGVRVSRWVSMHGLALNVTTKLEHFDLIIPCGLVGRSVTSMERELGAACPSMRDVKAAMTRAFVDATTERRTARPDSA